MLAADFQGGRLDETWLMAMFTWAEVCSRLGVLDRADEVYGLLAPFSGQLVAGGTIVSGSIDWALGILARTMERYEDADGHFAASELAALGMNGPSCCTSWVQLSIDDCAVVRAPAMAAFHAASVRCCRSSSSAEPVLVHHVGDHHAA